jgi:NADPH-dependent 2,4-dienoyl-CoA reductase/sulfur reductase-like enzyme
VTSVRRADSHDSGRQSDAPKSDTDPSQGGHSRWIVNNGEDGVFDAVIVTVGTCGAPRWIGFEGIPKEFIAQQKQKVKEDWEQKVHSSAPTTDTTQDKEDHEDKEAGEKEEGNSHADSQDYQGPILHSSQLDSWEEGSLTGKTVVVVGSGASGVEAVETALMKGAKHCVMIARDDKVGPSPNFQPYSQKISQWIIPRNLFIDVLIAMQPFGRQMPLR